MSTSNGVKKILFAISASAVLLLAAGQCLAAAYASVPGSGVIMNNASGQQAANGNVWFASGTPMMLYNNGQNIGYKMMSGQPAGVFEASTYAGRVAFWFSVMSVITVALVWIVLIQLIFVLHHWIKKHKH